MLIQQKCDQLFNMITDVATKAGTKSGNLFETNFYTLIFLTLLYFLDNAIVQKLLNQSHLRTLFRIFIEFLSLQIRKFLYSDPSKTVENKVVLLNIKCS